MRRGERAHAQRGGDQSNTKHSNHYLIVSIPTRATPTPTAANDNQLGRMSAFVFEASMLTAPLIAAWI